MKAPIYITYRPARFWSRIWAFLLDVIILGIVGMIIGAVFNQFLVSMGQMAPLIGLVVSVIYFTIGNSRLFGRQTIGKNVLNIQVIKEDGRLLTIKESFFRALLFCAPYFLTKTAFHGPVAEKVINPIMISVAGTAFAGIVILFLFNPESRQSLHDLIMRTVVTETEKLQEPIELQSVNKLTIWIFGTLAIVMIGASMVSQVRNHFSNHENESVAHQISRMDGVVGVSTTMNTTKMLGAHPSTSTSYRVRLLVEDFPVGGVDGSPIIQQVLPLIFEQVEGIDRVDVVSITLTHGYDMGIWKRFNSITESNTPAQRLEIIRRHNNHEGYKKTVELISPEIELKECDRRYQAVTTYRDRTGHRW